MPSKQYDVCQDVLRRLDEAGVLPGLVLIGSWCLVLYREYFRGVGDPGAIDDRLYDCSFRFSGGRT